MQENTEKYAFIFIKSTIDLNITRRIVSIAKMKMNKFTLRYVLKISVNIKQLSKKLLNNATISFNA